MEDKIYPSMVIRSQAEAIELLEKENQELKDRIDKTNKLIEKHEREGTLWFVKSTDELKEMLKGDKETPNLFKEVKTITEIPPVPKNMDTSRLQEFIDELKGDKE